MRHRLSSRFASWVLCAALVAAEAPAAESASPGAPCGPRPPPLAESLSGAARTDYEAGKLLYENRDFLGAIIKFQSAYDKAHDGRLLWNVAASHNQLKHYARTQQFMRRYLVEARCAATPQERVAAESAVAAAENLIVDVAFLVSPAGAELLVDGESYGQSPFPSHLRLDTGTHQLDVKKSGFIDHKQSIVLGAEKTVTVKVALVAEKASAHLRVSAGYGESISIDGSASSSLGVWEGNVEPGVHRVVVWDALGRREPAEKIVSARAGGSYSVELNTLPTKSAIPTWVWIAGGAAVTAGLVVGGYFLFKPGEPSSNVPAGTGGSVQLPSFRW